MKHRKTTEQGQHTDHPAAISERTRPVVTVDYERYQHLLDEEELTEDQKREFLQAIWNVVVNFIDLGFAVHPVNQAQMACGKFNKTAVQRPNSASDPVYCDDQLITEETLAEMGLDLLRKGQGVEQ